MATEKTLDEIKLTEEQQKEGYWAEIYQDRVFVWHKQNQLALLQYSPDIGHKVQEVVGENIKEHKEVEEKIGWKYSS